MKLRLVVSAVAFVSLALPGTSWSSGGDPNDKNTAGYLLDFCEKGLNERGDGWEVQLAYCMGVMHGARGVMEFGSIAAELGHSVPTSLKMCPPENVTTKALAQVFINYAKKHPERWNEPPIWMVMNAQTQTWPCG